MFKWIIKTGNEIETLINNMKTLTSKLIKKNLKKNDKDLLIINNL
jgi:hypothetical protein